MQKTKSRRKHFSRGLGKRSFTKMISYGEIHRFPQMFHSFENFIHKKKNNNQTEKNDKALPAISASSRSRVQC